MAGGFARRSNPLPSRALQGKWKSVEARVLGVPLLNLMVRAARQMAADDGPHLAAGVAYYALLSLFPLLLGLITILENADVDVPGAALDYAVRFLGLPVSIAVFLIVYKFVPNTKTHWRYVWTGAVLAGVLFEVAKNIFVVYLGQVADYESVYGSLGSVVALIVWLYISALILMLGAHFSSEYGSMRDENHEDRASR